MPISASDTGSVGCPISLNPATGEGSPDRRVGDAPQMRLMESVGGR